MSTMLEFSQNIADAEAPPQLPAGTYEATCVGAVPGVSKTSGNPTLPMTYKITKDQFPADFETDVDEITLVNNRITTRDTAADRFRMKNVCLAHGVPMSNKIDPNDFVMTKVRLEVTMGKDLEGNPRAEINKVLPL